MNPVVYLPQSKRLLDQVREVLRYKHYSLKIEQAYLLSALLFLYCEVLAIDLPWLTEVQLVARPVHWMHSVVWRDECRLPLHCRHSSRSGFPRRHARTEMLSHDMAQGIVDNDPARLFRTESAPPRQQASAASAGCRAAAARQTGGCTRG